MSRHPFVPLVILALLASVLVSLFTTSTAFAKSEAGLEIDVYIVRMVEPPAVAYDGGIAGLKATRPAKGTKIDPDSPDVVRYVSHLTTRHDALVNKAKGEKVYDYGYSFNGFAARISGAAAAALALDPAVVTVEKTVEVTMDTATTPAFLGLTDPVTGLWTRNIKGENVIVGILDSGIWPESKSFSDRDASGRLVYQHPRPKDWKGKCQHGVEGEGWDVSDLCNKKLIGARWFAASRGIENVLPHEFLSPRDFNGHGTHTASTAAGNEGVVTTGAAALFGTVNGIAPRARVAAYKVCWDNGAGGCGANTGDVVAAIDLAVADGVDVINYSISGTQTNYLDSVEVAYLFAADAGVFVATSAGNSGPTASTVAHISPWLASVAAGTHNRSGTATVTFGAGGPAPITGASLTEAVGPAQLIKSSTAGKAEANPTEVTLCFLGTLDPAKVTGKIVQCDRGVNARVDKSAAVKEAGGVGMILTNVTAGSLNADLHTVPTVHVADTFRASILSYIDSAGASATASLSKAVVNTAAPAPEVAAFSSRGPSRAGGGDILKPDFMLPGVDVLAAVAPPGNHGKDFDLFSGTSMSSPHVAGVAALLTQAYPDWSPAAMRSAMATTAHQNIVPAGSYSPFGAGSGQVQPNKMVDPGLVYEAGFNDYLAFLKGQGLCCASSASIPTLDASDLNQPSIAIGDLAGVQTITRRVTNVGSAAASYNAAVTAPTGFTVSVSPSSFTISAGGTQQFTVAITRTDAAPLNAYRFGSLTWSDGSHSVRSPIVIRPVAIAAPAELTLSGASGTTSYGIKTGYAGALAYAKRGLIPSTTFSGTVTDDPTDNFNTGNPTANQGIRTHDIVTPSDASLLRISMFDPETDGNDDIDLYLYRVNADSSLTLVGLSGGGTSAEQIQITPAASTTYRLFVHGWQTDGPDAVYKLHSWALGTADAGNMTVTGPSTATIGGTGTVNLSWTGLAASQRYLGQIRYNEGATTHGTTIVRVDVP